MPTSVIQKCIFSHPAFLQITVTTSFAKAMDYSKSYNNFMAFQKLQSGLSDFNW